MGTSISGVGLTEFGRHPGPSALDWQVRAASEAVADAGLEPSDIDGLIAGYATTSGHLMPANVLAERLGMRPKVAFGTSVGGATGLAMIVQACHLVQSGAADRVLVAAGENRSSGQTRDESTRVLAQVGHPDYEVPLGGTIPVYYALLASRYLWENGLPDDALVDVPVQLRRNAATKEGAHYSEPISADDVRCSRLVAKPLRLLECCPVSDGGAAFVVSATPTSDRSIAILGSGQAHRHQHLCSLQPGSTGAGEAAKRAFAQAGKTLSSVDVFGVYDSFSITLAMILEEIGLVPQGRTGEYAGRAAFAPNGAYPLNTHGGLLSYGHCGVAGGMAHLAEVVTQMRGERGESQVHRRDTGYIHADGGVLSAHVGLVLGQEARR